MLDLPDPLRAALDAELVGVPGAQLSRAVETLIERYRDPDGAGRLGGGAILSGRAEVRAYAAYRMPATYAAVRSAFEQVAVRMGEGFAPRSQVDVGGGTGAAVWAAADAWSSLRRVQVLERVPEVIELGRRLAAASPEPAVRDVEYREYLLTAAAELPAADLLSMSYVLGELSEAEQAVVVGELARRAEVGAAVVLVEPGTPAGYRRILTARQQLIDAGLGIVAPCPHSGPCPLVGADWCHFAARVNRSSLHRRIKGGTLGHEDEKFSYVAAVRGPSVPEFSGRGRVLRHPQRRKGLVGLRLCRPDGTAGDVVVSKRHREEYRAAKDIEWGEEW